MKKPREAKVSTAAAVVAPGAASAKPPRKASGGAYEKRGKFYARVTVAANDRTPIALPWATNLEAAQARAHVLQGWVSLLRQAGDKTVSEWLEKVLELGAKYETEEEIAALGRQVDLAVEGKIEKVKPRVEGPPLTFRDLADDWTSGELHRRHPDHVPVKRSAADDVSLMRHIPDEHLDLPLSAWTCDTYEDTMRRLRAGLSSATRRAIAQIMHRLFELAVYPVRAIKVSPIPRMPKIVQLRLVAVLRPEHPAKVAACKGVDLGYRFLWCFLAETGWRLSQAVGREEPVGPNGVDNTVPAFRWKDVLWKREIAFLSRTKTTAAVEVPLDEPTIAALRAWKTLSPRTEPEDNVFVTTDGIPLEYNHAPDAFRSHLQLAGFSRETDPDLFPEGDELKHRLPLRCHDLRGLFVTASLAQGRSDTWVKERTLHKTTAMLEHYRAKVAHFKKLGPIVPAMVAIPEIATAVAAFAAPKTAQRGYTANPSRAATMPFLAEEEGFEPPVALRPRLISNQLP